MTARPVAVPLTPAARALYRAGLIGALVTFACAVAFQVLSTVHADVRLQPTDVPLPADAFLRPLNDRSEAVLSWMAFDTVFVVAYLTAFAAARALAVSRTLGALSLGAMVTAGALDMVENAVLAVHAAQAWAAEPLTTAPTMTLYAVAQLKTAAATTGIAFLALALPAHDRMLRAAIVAAGAFVLVTVAGVALPELAPVEALPILLFTGLLAGVFTRRLKAGPLPDPATPAQAV
ncbi:hypothetical protein SSP531S_10110 [Streptomyces spongiicola]|uniref:DUF4386 domain-containing protein n=1 Tax=Streptomyces spongiicola TaxID=1690221 RepID=A0A388SSQ8_9ACTN|nr:hypothetical protein [Streptomyces spongiicola]GBP99616.1 hypothetical protein SSP531S_10110 [Streptomyces spongiicola]